jgi:pimeloyl-ACP methyl ester carboxylesterase
MSARGIPADFDPRDLRPPARWELVRELRVLRERLALAAALPQLRRQVPPGNGEAVMVVPGFATDDGWTEKLRSFLTSIGYETTGWGLGRNRGNVPDLIPQIIDRLDKLFTRCEMPVRVVGWSLGGYLAREAARERPELVDRVVTLGSPVVGGPIYTASAPIYTRKGYDLDEIAASVLEREQHPIEVPVYALYSRTDGVVSWRASIDTFDNALVEHHEVAASHLGMVSSPRAYRLIAELLATDPRGI